MLDPDEASVFRRFAVLDGPVGLQLVRAVVSGGPLAPVRVVRILRELTARGLLSVDRSGAALALPAGRRPASVRARAARRARARSRPRSTGSPTRSGPCSPTTPRRRPRRTVEAITDCSARSARCSAPALEGSADRGRCLELAFRLHRYWAATNVAEGRFWLSRLLADAPPGRGPRYATYALGYLGYWAGRHRRRRQRPASGGRGCWRARATRTPRGR